MWMCYSIIAVKFLAAEKGAKTNRWLSAKLQQLQFVCNVITAVLH